MSALGQKQTCAAHKPMSAARCSVRFAPESRHSRLRLECPLNAKNGHRVSLPFALSGCNSHHCQRPTFLIAVGSVFDLFFLQ